MLTEIYTNIDEPQLKKAWETLEYAVGAFPQSGWYWCACWWRYCGRGRKLHIIVVRDDCGNPIGLAPFVRDSILGLSYLRSIPENYGDFYDYLVSPTVDATLVFQHILASLTKYDVSESVLFFNVNSESKLSTWIRESNINFASKILTKNVVTELNYDSVDAYMSALSKNRRNYIRKKQRSFERDYSVTKTLSTDVSRYLEVFDELFALQAMRWEGDRPKRSQSYIDLVRDSNAHYFEKKQMCLLEVRADGRLASYRIGFIHNNAYYDWNTSYDIGFQDYSPGALSIAYLMELLIQSGINNVDFMAGYYDYKVSYSPSPVERINSLYVLRSGSIGARLVAWYFIEGRYKLKMLRDNIFNTLSKLRKNDKR